MSYILVILQSTSGGFNWMPMGEFKDEKACKAAIMQLADPSQAVRGIKNFQCLKKD